MKKSAAAYWGLAYLLALIFMWGLENVELDIGATFFAWFLPLVIAVFPFLTLAYYVKLKQEQKENGWKMGIACAALTVGIVYWEVYSNLFSSGAAARRGGGGVDFGAVFLVMFSPFYFPILIIVSYKIGRYFGQSGSV